MNGHRRYWHRYRGVWLLFAIGAALILLARSA